MSWRSFKKKISWVINMNDYVPDMLDQFEEYEAEQARVHRRIKQNAREWALAEMEDITDERVDF